MYDCESCSAKVEWSVKLPIRMLKVGVTRIPYAFVEKIQSPLLYLMHTFILARQIVCRYPTFVQLSTFTATQNMRDTISRVLNE